MQGKASVSELIKRLNLKVQEQNQNKSKKKTNEKGNITNKKSHTNFKEMLSIYRKTESDRKMEEKELVNELDNAYNYFLKVKKQMENDLEKRKDLLFLYRMKKATEIIQIYKLFEFQTDILKFLIEFNKDKNPNAKLKSEYSQKIKIGKDIINFRKTYENSLFKRDPELDKIKLFNENDSQST